MKKTIFKEAYKLVKEKKVIFTGSGQNAEYYDVCGVSIILKIEGNCTYLDKVKLKSSSKHCSMHEDALDCYKLAVIFFNIAKEARKLKV